MWPLATIGRLLRNEAYVGRLFWNRTHTSYDPSVGHNRQSRRPREEWVQIPVPAIVAEETFESVQQAARANTVFSLRRTEPDTFLLRRLVRCGHCGVKLAAHRARREYGMSRYYACPHRDLVRAGGTDRRCPERRIHAHELDAFVFDQVCQLLGRPDLLSAGEAAVAAEGPVPDDELFATQLARLDRRCDGAEAERRRLADLYQAGVIESAEMTRRAAELDARRRHLDQERQALVAQRAELVQANNLQPHTALYRRSLRWFGLPACTASPEGQKPPSLEQHGSCWRPSTSPPLPFQDALQTGIAARARANLLTRQVQNCSPDPRVAHGHAAPCHDRRHAATLDVTNRYRRGRPRMGETGRSVLRASKSAARRTGPEVSEPGVGSRARH